jgi:mannose-6-phosphate isomerase
MKALGALHIQLAEWLVQAAYPLWSTRGIDAGDGGFIEALDRNAAPLAHPRRARVPPRQIYTFAQAPGFGWQGDAGAVVLRGTEYFTNRYRRPDGLFRTLVSAEGTVLDERALLYDQAFALLGYAAAANATNALPAFERRAIGLRNAIESRFRAGDGAFFSDEESRPPRESNPHMHLLEACLAWAEISADAGWTQWTRGLVELALSRFILRDTGAMGESFEENWQPATGGAGRLVEPGHQFEWAWLLLRSAPHHTIPVRDVALRLIAIGENFGVHNGVAVNALLDDFTVRNGDARLWPQTERLKAALRAASLTGDQKYWSIAQAAAASLCQYLDTPIRGLWFDERQPDGTLVDSPVPASTFYHLVGAIAELDVALRNANSGESTRRWNT